MPTLTKETLDNVLDKEIPLTTYLTKKPLDKELDNVTPLTMPLDKEGKN